MIKTLNCLATVVIVAVAAFGQSTLTTPSFVAVVGEAIVSAAPDQVTFTFEVVTSGMDLLAAKNANDVSVAKTLDAARSTKIDAKDIQTENLSITPKYNTPKDRAGARTFAGYEITKRILVTLRDLTNIDAFLGKAIEAGVNKIVDVSFANSEINKYVEQARAAAVENAENKARAYAAQLGQSVGKAVSIREEGADLSPFGSASGSGSGSGNGDGTSDNSSDAETEKVSLVRNYVTFALGRIKIEEKIYVTFWLQ